MNGTIARIFGLLNILALLNILLLGAAAYPSAASHATESSNENQQATPNRAYAADMLRLATVMLQQIEGAADYIPVAVLNDTKCLLIINEVAAENGHSLALKTCRKPDNWLPPEVFTVQLYDASPMVKGGLILLVMGDEEAKEVAAGSFNLQQIAEGTLVRDSSPKSVAEVAHRAAVAYTLDGQALRPVAIGGVTGSANEESTAWLKAEIEHPVRVHGGPGADVQAEGFAREVNAFFSTIQPSGIIIHHSAILPPDPDEPGDYLDQFHAARGFSIVCGGRTYHVAYHYIILENGNIELGRPDRCEGAHTRGFNGYIGIVVVGDFSSHDNRDGHNGAIRPSTAQMARLVELCRHLRDQYHIPIQHVLQHGDVGRTDCPGDNFPFRKFLAQLLTPAGKHSQ